MDLDREPSEIAYSAAEEIRALNHRTLSAKAYGTPADVSSVVDSVLTAVSRLQQSLRQAGAGLTQLDAEQKIRMDDGGDPSERAAAVQLALEHSVAALGSVETALLAAAGPLSHMGGHFPADDVDDDPDCE